MALPPLYNLRDLGPQAQQMANACKNERLAMTLQYVALGSMILMGVASAVHVYKDLFRTKERHARSR